MSQKNWKDSYLRSGLIKKKLNLCYCSINMAIPNSKVNKKIKTTNFYHAWRTGVCDLTNRSKRRRCDKEFDCYFDHGGLSLGIL